MNNLVKFLKEQKVKETGAFSKGVNKGLNIAISAIKNPQICPTIEQPKWISCAERLPTEGGIFLVCKTFDIWEKEHKIIGLEQFSKRIGGWYCDGAKITNVTHWMPLPMPPKGDE